MPKGVTGAAGSIEAVKTVVGGRQMRTRMPRMPCRRRTMQVSTDTALCILHLQ